MYSYPETLRMNTNMTHNVKYNVLTLTVIFNKYYLKYLKNYDSIILYSTYTVMHTYILKRIICTRVAM